MRQVASTGVVVVVMRLLLFLSLLTEANESLLLVYLPREKYVTCERTFLCLSIIKRKMKSSIAWYVCIISMPSSGTHWTDYEVLTMRRDGKCPVRTYCQQTYVSSTSPAAKMAKRSVKDTASKSISRRSVLLVDEIRV